MAPFVGPAAREAETLRDTFNRFAAEWDAADRRMINFTATAGLEIVP